jgi:hypothetical protein
MNRKPNIAAMRRQLKRIEEAFYAASNQDGSERSRKLGRAADLLTEILACEIYGMR